MKLPVPGRLIPDVYGVALRPPTCAPSSLFAGHVIAEDSILMLDR